jgi:hypothetical protein
MPHRCLRFFAVVLFSVVAAAVAVAQPRPPTAIGTPPLDIWRPPVLLTPGAEQPVRLQALQVEVDVAGRVAQTRVRMTFFNPNGRLLEGKLQFPLAEGQAIAGFALDVDGVLRDAVPVEKARAEQVFEDISRRRVDPGLLQQTVGRNYEVRVYPLPPGRTRVVELTLVETAGARLAIPVGYARRVDAFDLVVRHAGSPGSSSTPTVAAPNALGLRFLPEAGGGLVARATLRDATLPEQPVVVVTADDPMPTVTTEARDGRTWFSLDLPVPERRHPRPLPTRVQLVWDASGSGGTRRLERELALLDAYFGRAGNVEVNLVRVADTVQPGERHVVRRGDWSSLRRALEATAYDGASNLGAVVHDGVSTEALWFTDGLANYGTAPWSLQFPVPVYAVNSAPAAHPAALRRLAENSGGRWIDLAALTSADAARALLERGWQLDGVQADGAEDVVAASIHPEQGRLALAGVLTATEATLEVRLRTADGSVTTQRIRVSAGARRGRLAAAQWARLRLAQLEAEPRLHKVEIRQIGRRFGMATAETSLIVLERVEDYVQHDIEPPRELREPWERLMAQARRTRQRSEAERIAQVIRRFDARVAWWQTDFPKGEPPLARTQPKPLEVAGATGNVRQARVEAQARRDSSLSLNEMRAAGEPTTANAPAAAAPAAPPARFAEERMQSMAKSLDAGAATDQLRAKKDAGPGVADRISIGLQPASRSAPYLQRLADAPASDAWAVYLDERREQAQSVGFFLDAAEFFLSKGRRAEGLRILSNLAEMDLQNRQVLRLLGYRLQQAGEAALAVPVFERVLELAPYEPQSHRDLGLVLAAAGQPQRAVERLYAVVTGQWDARFPDIDLIALTELNAVVDASARAGKPLDVGFVEPRLLRNLPVDVRVVLAWDADNTDVDLHVFDPNGEEVYFGHNASYQGGAITRDATGGYGPEEFALKVAKPGRYRIEAQFYGHRQQVLTSSTGLMLWLSSGFGTPRQEDRRSTVRVKSEGGTRVVIGEFEVRP